ncbi:CidA/LrgA family protein [Acinetobacter brisouii]
MNTKPNMGFQLLKLLPQLGLLAIFWWCGNLIHQKFSLPISSGILGMFLLLICLFAGLIKLEQVALGANAVLAELVLFFVPIVVAVVQYKQLFLTEGWQIVVSIGIGTMLVMLSTSLTIHYTYRLKKYWHVRKRLQHRMH